MSARLLKRLEDRVPGQRLMTPSGCLSHFAMELAPLLRYGCAASGGKP